MKSYLSRYFTNQSVKMKIFNLIRLVLAVFIGVFWLFPGFIERKL